ncbi:uncharacterized protein LOC131694895 [Topomyia yanbarensis]|uniref:uncharacterized protein LOC131694895 n=1 Tax=Topomyia yanbarensis TaxID=2498891 RepID=UPI00273A7FF2|nr:uncharacterized protein LOC131694895 [Topomyia yanbarensis]
MQEVKLQIAHHKTEVLLVRNCKVLRRAEITVREHIIVSKRVLKQLGVMIDDRLNFNTHVGYACEKAAKAINALARMRANNAGPCSSTRRLLASVSSSILRYGGPVCVAALETHRNRVKLSSTFRLMAMRVTSAYRTISSEAGMFPIGIIVVEDNECYKRKGIWGIRKTMRADSMAKCQYDWVSTHTGSLHLGKHEAW